MDYPRYDPASPNTPLTDDELRGLDAWLQSLVDAGVDGAMSLDGMDGYLTGLLVGPASLDALATADWLPAVWGGDAAGGSSAVFASNQKRKRTTVLVLRHLQSIACQLRDDPARWEPVFSIAEVADRPDRELADATEWCLGFLQAVDLAPEAWAPLFADPALAPGLTAIAQLGGDPSWAAAAPDLDDPERRDALSRAVADGVVALWERAGRPAAAGA